MNVDTFYEKLKQIFETNERDTTPTQTPTRTQTQTCNKIIVKLRKQYITANEIISMFEITKEAYNNLLVRRKY